MIEVINHIYTQRFFAKKTKFSDLFKAVTNMREKLFHFGIRKSQGKLPL